MSDESPPPTLPRLRPKTQKPGRFTGDQLEYIPPSRGNAALSSDDMSPRKPGRSLKRSSGPSSNSVVKKKKLTKPAIAVPPQVPGLPKYLRYIKQAEERYKDEIRTRGNDDDNPVWKANKDWALGEVSFVLLQTSNSLWYDFGTD